VPLPLTSTATLVALFAGPLTPAERADLDAYVRKHNVALLAPRPTPASPYRTHRPDLVLDLEGRLDEARKLATSLDEERALAELTAIERDLLHAPELPQASFLLAERHRIEAELRRGQPGGVERMRELVQRSEALEGPRATAFGELEEEPTSGPPSVEVYIADLGPRDVLELDGERKGARSTLVAGQHHVRVLRDGELIFAGYLGLEGEPDARVREVRLGVRPVVPCSREDIGAPDGTGRVPRFEPGVSCERWFAVRRTLGQLELSDCSRDQCSPFVRLVQLEVKPSAEQSGWLGPVLFGAGSAAALLGVLWAGGAFERDRAAEQTVLVYRGLR
jgi:hypothetical protein